MPSVTYTQYCKIAGIESGKTTEKKEQKKIDEMKDLSYADFFGQYGADGLNHFTVAELKEELSAQGLSNQGVKADLISRLEDHYKDHKRKSSSDKKESKHQKTEDVDLEGKNKNNVVGGYKATVHNPNVSDEAKEHAQEVLDKMGVDADEKVDSSRSKRSDGSTEGKNPNNVAGGFKATLHNENASEEAKEHAQEMLDEMGVDADEKAESTRKRSSGSTEGKNKGNVIGGYRATLHNDKVSEEAKAHAKKMLKELGAHDTDHSTDADVEGKNLNNVIGGYRATLHNANSSEEAKDHARKVLEELGADPEGHTDSSSSHRSSGSTQGKNKGNVIGGYRATLHNDKVSEEAKAHAKKMLKELGAHDTDHSTDADVEGKNLNNVIGGYRATLHNANSSEEAKDHARKVLEELGADPEGHAESTSSRSSGSTEGKNKGNVIGGYRATLHNDKVSEEAKAHAKKMLKELGAHETDHSTDSDVEGKNLNNVIGGYKATLHNANSSEEAKDHARKVLGELGVDEEDFEESSAKKSSGGHVKDAQSEGKNPNNVAGGYKATLKNPNASEDAKRHAKQELDASKNF